MRPYEAVVIFPTLIPGEAIQEGKSAFEEALRKHEGKVLSRTEMGKRLLGYTVKKQKEYRACSLSCNKQAQAATDNVWCEDSDKGNNFFEKGVVKTNIYLSGKEDKCYTSPNLGKTYLFEGICKNNKYQSIQKSCAELGKDYKCDSWICVKELTKQFCYYLDLQTKGQLPAGENRRLL